MIKLALVDDHVVMRNCLSNLIGQYIDVQVLFEASNGLEIEQYLKLGPLPDVILLDINMPKMDGMATVAWLKIHYPSIRIIILSMLKNEFVIASLVTMGVNGFLQKDTSIQELVEAIERVMYEPIYFNKVITPKLISELKSHTRMKFSAGELFFLKHSVSEMTHKEMAKTIHVSPRTIDSYRDSLLLKLNVETRVGIALYAIKHGLVEL